MAQRVKCLRAMQETWVRSLLREDPLQKEIATHSSTLAWRIPWTEEPGRLQSMGSQRVLNDWATLLSLRTKSLPYVCCDTIYCFLEYKNINYVDLVFLVKDKHERIACTGKYRMKENKVCSNCPRVSAIAIRRHSARWPGNCVQEYEAVDNGKKDNKLE